MLDLHQAVKQNDRETARIENESFPLKMFLFNPETFYVRLMTNVDVERSDIIHPLQRGDYEDHHNKTD